jgi:3-oxoacyl-[acyl-carrier-protein] synthase III
MKIESVKLSLPSKLITNENILTYIKENSSEISTDKLDQIISHVKLLLRASGSKNRYWRDTHDSPIKLLKDAYQRAMKDVNWKNDDIDLLVYVGVGRGFLEPGGAYTVAQSLGLNNVICFDLLDACMSWARAVEIIHNYFQLGKYKKAIIVNAEFSIYEYSYPDLYHVTDEEKLNSCFPAYTVGEAATVTLLSNENPEPWEFHFSSRPDLADLCTIPLPDFKLFTDSPSEKMGKNGTLLFTSYGLELHNFGFDEGVNIFNQLAISKTNKQKINIVFTHASSTTAWKQIGKEVGVDEKIYDIYSKTGNLVSASVPAAMALAFEEGKLKRGDNVVCWVASAGMSFGVFNFCF